jgi:hypothetical protein
MRLRSQVSASSAADALLGATKKKEETASLDPLAAADGLFTQYPPHPGGAVLPMATSPVEDLSILQRGLLQGGVSVSLLTVGKWTPEEREMARKWVVDGRGWEPATRPPFLAEYAAITRALGGVKVEPPESVKKALAEVPGPAIPPDAQAHRTGSLRAEEKREEPKAPPPLFATANKGPGITPDFARIIETVYAADAFKDYDDLERNLEVGEQRGDYLTLREHLDRAEQRARRAHKLYLGAKLERANWERDAEVTSAAMRNSAHEELEAEKKDGDRKKMITDADVTSRVAEMFPDEWRAQETTRHKLKGVESSIEHLVKMWDAKVFSLRTLLETLRK